MQWERCEFDFTRSNRNHKDIIWLSTNSGKHYSRLNISANLCTQANLKTGDSIWLYKSGTTFLIKKEPSDFYLKPHNYRSKENEVQTLGITNMNFVAKILSAFVDRPQPPKVFDAVVTDEGIMFEARKE